MFGSTARSMSRPTAPGRRITGEPCDRSTTVDSTPTSVGPPSTTMSIRSLRSAITCIASVGLGREKRFALGAAIGTPAADMRARATGLEGTRIALYRARRDFVGHRA